MVCDVGCRKCDVSGGDYIIKNYNVSHPTGAIPGTLVTINVVAQINCVFCLNRDFWICLYDDITGECITSSGALSFTGVETEKSISLTYSQPEYDFHANLSLAAYVWMEPSACFDTKKFTVISITLPGQGYSCNPVTKTCFSDSQSTKTYAQCTIECSGSGPGSCKQGEMNVMGYCVPEPIMFISALGLLYMIIKK